MDNSTLFQLIMAVGVVIAMVGGVVIRDRMVMGNIECVRSDVMAAMKAGDEALHERVNRVRDEYVRRDDLLGHIARIEKSIDGMMEEQRRANDRIDKILAAVVNTTN